ncbi:hypothetical protein [Mycolicibacterium sp. 050158]|uniref:hypothetical protein n=1 Tax=Mycolicibacterium sp. 050158 TaxID=3090602 RepID=UPI00299CFC23|nr:hypothetical protein [Mycolicibacterium sp. 050158]MDX1890746.1 hypothetical protein [Mycolicibacterium sp. 050158]
MDSPRSGLRRARAASWALVGVGVAGVAGASSLAYADTYKPPAVTAPVVAIEPAPALAPEAPPASSPVTTTTDLAPPTTDLAPPTTDPAPPTTDPAPVEPAPTTHWTPTPEYTPSWTTEQAPAPTTPASQPPTTRRRPLAPTTVMAPNYSPRITMSHGS